MSEPYNHSASSNARLQRFAHKAMACEFEILIADADASYAGQATRAAFAELDRVEAELSRFIPTSDVARINTLEPGGVVHIGLDTQECLTLAAAVQADTGGAFDIAFASDNATPHADAPLLFDPASRSVGVSRPGVRIDLGGIGKGYAVDRMTDILRDWNIDAALVHGGQSTVLALGRPGEEAWRPAIRDPENPDKTLSHVPLHNAALSGSGRRLQGDHIIDPRASRNLPPTDRSVGSARPTESRMKPAVDKLGAWAVAPSAAFSDALSTAFMVMSQAEIDEFCRKHEAVSALVRIPTDDGPKSIAFGSVWRC